MFTGIFFQGINGTTVNFLVAFLGIIATILTVGYTFWPLRRIFFGKLPEALENVHEAPLTMVAPLLALAVIAIFIGIYPEMFTRLLIGYARTLPGLGGH